MALNITMASYYGLNLTDTSALNFTDFGFDYEGEDPRFFDPTEDSNEDYNPEDWNREQFDDSELNPTITKIIGGHNARRGEVPHQVSLRNVFDSYSHFCGASIIHPLLLLTAAHCITVLNLVPEQIQVIAGEHNLAVSEEGEQVRNVSQIILHSGWNTTTLENDIALLVLSEPLQFDDYIRSIEIAKGGEIRPEKAKVSGWGKTTLTDRSAFNEHQVALIRFVKWEHCRQFYSRRTVKITENMVCAGGKKRDACEGDSGGPLTCQEILSNETYLCGIVSWGDKRCGTRGWPGVYTDVSNYYTWIRKYVRIWDRRIPSPSDNNRETLFVLMSHSEPFPPRSVRMNASGTQATWHGEFSHQVWLRQTAYPQNFICSASVISPILLLTVAHCTRLYGSEGLMAVTGDYRMRSYEGTEQIRKIRRVIVHERWNAQTGDNDIAILVLEDPLRFDNYTRPIDIPRGNVSRRKAALLSSWDVTNKIDGPSDVPLKLPGQVLGQSLCRSTFEQFQHNTRDSTLCVRNRMRNFCGGDSGDPLTCEKRGSGHRYLCGLAIRGVTSPQSCGRFPQLYTNVLKYQGWIHMHIQTLWQQYQVAILGGSVDSREDCSEERFRCPNNGFCIPKDFRCDGEHDCDPLSDWDERNCTMDQAPDLAAERMAKNSSETIMMSSELIPTNNGTAVQNM